MEIGENKIRSVPISIVRGGTSKGIFIMEDVLPKDPKERDRVILKIFGSPDIRQIDGLGGADVLTSKLAVIGPGSGKKADVDYTFGQVSITEPFIDYGGNCGNISSAVGGFAIDHGLVKTEEPYTTVRIRMTNTDRILKAVIPVKNGRAEVYGDYAIDGVPGTGAKVMLDWSDAAGGITGKLLPTGNAVDVVEAGGGEYRVSVVDAGNVVIFAEASSLGIDGTETPLEIEADRALMDQIEEIRGRVCEKLGLVSTWQEAKTVTPYQPFFAMVSRPKDHTCFNGVFVPENGADLVARLVFMLHMHKAYPITGTVATGAACCIPGSLVWNMMREEDRKKSCFTIAHPSGTLSVEAAAGTDDCGNVKIARLMVARTARTILDGTVYIKEDE